ncbi:MAG: NosD domain-containing protein [Nitrososphaeraceae archaeon]
MDQRNTTRTILAVMIAAALVVSVGSIIALHILPADATKPKHNDGDNNGNSNGDNVVNIIPQQSQMTPLSLGTSPNSRDNVESGDFATQQLQPQQQAQPQPQQQAQPQQQQASSSSSAACGQVVSGVVNLTANLNCSGDGIIVGGPNTVINMNGFSITGPGQDSSKVAIMVPNVDNVVVNGPGSLSNFQAGVLLTGANGFQINSVILSNNQIGTFMTGAENAQVQQNIVQNNNLGIASHSSSGSKLSSNLMSSNLLAGITFVNTKGSTIDMNNIHGSQNGVFVDGQSADNTIYANNILDNVVDLNNANGLPTNINTNQFTDNSCQTSNPSGLCIGR